MLASYPFAGVALARLVVICLVAYFRSVRWIIDCWQAILGSFELEETSQRKEREREIKVGRMLANVLQLSQCEAKQQNTHNRLISVRNLDYNTKLSPVTYSLAAAA